MPPREWKLRQVSVLTFDTRVPVRALFENLEDGATVNDFLTWFTGVTHEQVEAVLEHVERSLAVA
jgi:uncharacterized protein (DUF433 family)